MNWTSSANVAPTPDLDNEALNEVEGGADNSLTFMLLQSVQSNRDGVNLVRQYFSPSHSIASSVVSASRRPQVSRLFELDDDGFNNLLSWLDFGCLCKLDTAIGNADERYLWLHILHRMDSKAVDEFEHSHSSIRWLIRRGAKATRIRIRGTELDRITDQTFAGVSSIFTTNADIGDRNDNLNDQSAGTLKNHSTMGDRLRSRDVAIETNTVVSVRPWGCPGLTSIGLSHCPSISDIGVIALAEGCSQLQSIDLSHCRSISDIGVSSIAGGCPHLTSINLSGCPSISDIGVSALAEGCPHLTSIDLSNCARISDIGISALAEGCPHLTSINLSCCKNVSNIGISALAEGCHDLTSIRLYGCRGISKSFIITLRKNYPFCMVEHN